MRVLTRSAEFNNLIRESHRQCTDDHRMPQCKSRSSSPESRWPPAASSLQIVSPPGGDCYIRCDEQCQPQELRLCSQPYCCHRIGPERTHHKSIHHTRQCDKKDSQTAGHASRIASFVREPVCVLCPYLCYLLPFLVYFLFLIVIMLYYNLNHTPKPPFADSPKFLSSFYSQTHNFCLIFIQY